MPRRKHIIVPGVPHHVTQRVAHGEFLLRSDDSKAVLASLLADWAERQGVVVHAFAILDNHFHLSATPPDESALAKMLGFAAQGLSRWLNIGIGECGPNWQSRFYASPMDPCHAAAAARYIERNPVAAGLVSRADAWHWSSAAFHVGRGMRPRRYVPTTWVTESSKHMGDRSRRLRRTSADALEGNLRRVGTSSPGEAGP